MASPQAMDMDHMEVKSEQGLSPDAYVKEEAAGVKEEEEDKKMEMKQEMATTEWTEGLIPEATDLDLQKNLVISALKQLLEKFGSARVYLEQRYKERAEAMLFYEYLHTLSAQSHPMHNLFDSKKWSEQPSSTMLKLPTWCFSFAALCSVKPDTDQKHTMDLAEQILTNGFESQADPLLVTLRPDVMKACPCQVQPADRLQPFAVGFCKGKARMHTLLSILSIFHDNNLKIEEVARPTFSLFNFEGFLG